MSGKGLNFRKIREIVLKLELGAMRKNSRLTRQELFSAELSGVGLDGRPENQLGEPGSEGRLSWSAGQRWSCEVSLGEDIDKRLGE